MCKKLFFVILTLLSVGAMAQHPFSLDWRVVKTPNGKLIYPSYLGYDAARIAGGICNVAAADTVNIGVMPRKFPILVSAPSNTSNGYTTLSPYKMVLYTRPMDGTNLGSSEWFQTLLTHEYRHLVQYRMFDRGFTRLAHCVFGYVGWSMMMYSVPQWFYEGDAVYAETVLSNQGRGRAASFDMPISALLQDNDRLFLYDKMILRSYRDMIPNHYPVGYMLVTGAKRKYGADIYDRTARSQSWYSFWPFAFGCGFHSQTGERLGKSYRGIYGELKDFYKQRSTTLDVRDYKVVNNAKKRFYTSYMAPCFIGDNRILCVKSSMAKAAQFVVLDTLGREVEVLGHTDADGFDSDGKVAVYITNVPDVRWSERNFSDIAVFDIQKRTTQIVTKKCKYGSIAIDRDGKRVVVVDFSEDRVCKIVVLSLINDGSRYSAKVLKSYYSRPLEFFRCPQFVGDDKVAFISNYNNRNCICILDLGTMNVSDVTPYSTENIPEICPSDDGNTLYYISDRSGIDNIYRVPVQRGEPSQVTNVRYGASDIFVDGDRIYFNSYTSKGYNIVYCGADDVVEMQNPSGLNYFAPLLPKELSGTLNYLATAKPDTTLLSKSKKYHQYSDPFRFLGWMPDVESPNYSVTMSTANNLETLYTTVTESYNKDYETWRTGIGITYSGFYPELYFGTSFGDVGDRFMVPTFWGKPVASRFTWRENVYTTSVTLPFNLSRLWYEQNLNLSVGLSWYDVSDKPIATYEEIPNGGFGIWQGKVSYSWSRHSAYRDFKSPLAFSLGAGIYRALEGSDTDASMVSSSASFTVPGFFRQNYISVSGNLIRQCQRQYDYRLYLFDHAAFDLRGYSSARMQSFARLSGEYSFPLGYPDFGIPSLIWIKRFRGAVIGDLASGKLFGTKYDFASVGVRALMDFCVLRLNYNISVGVTVAKGLKTNGLEGTETNFVLTLPF